MILSLSNRKPAEASPRQSSNPFGDYRFPIISIGTAPAGDGELRMSLIGSSAADACDALRLCMVGQSLILTMQGFGQHEPLLWLGLHVGSFNKSL